MNLEEWEKAKRKFEQECAERKRIEDERWAGQQRMEQKAWRRKGLTKLVNSALRGGWTGPNLVEECRKLLDDIENQSSTEPPKELDVPK